MQTEKAVGATPGQQPTAENDVFDTASVLTIAVAHGGHDMYTAFLSPLLPLLISKLSMPLAVAGVLPSVLKAGSLAQPFIGVWADRTDARYFVIAAPTITALSMSAIGIAPSYLAIVLLLAIAGLSHAIFHPGAGAIATRSSGRSWGRGSAYYMAGGSLGLTVAPIYIVSVVTWLGLEGSYVAAIPGVMLSALLFLRLRAHGAPRLKPSSTAGIWKTVKSQRRALLLLSGFVLFRSTSNVSFATFYPTFLMDRGSSLMFAGLAMTVYQLSGALGSLAAGGLSDSMGRRTILVGSLLVSGPLLYLTLASPEGPVGLAMLAVSGAMVMSANPVQMALFQELMPEARSTASGIWSFLSFEGSLATTLVVGVVADRVGLGPALGLSVLASMLSIPFILAMPEPRRSNA